MRIISKFHDYYDVGMRYGFDHDCIYKRDSTSFTKEKEFLVFNPIVRIFGRVPYSFDALRATHIFLFCGKLYMCLEVYGKTSYGGMSYGNTHFIYTIDELNKYIDGDYKLEKSIFQKSKYPHGVYGDIEEILKKIPIDKNDELIDLLVEYRTPIIRYTHFCRGRSREVEINPCLKSFEFFRVIDPFTAYQEISSFISGVIGGTSPNMVEIKDVVRLEKHGFDKITSFRNMK